MPTPSAINSLTQTQREKFEEELMRRNFSDYDGLVSWLKTNGFELSRSTAYRHGSALKKRLNNLRNATDASILIAKAAPDDEDLRSAAVISMVQSDLFDLMVKLQELDATDDPAERVGLLKETARAVLDMTKASLMQKQWSDKIKSKLQIAAKEAHTIAKAAGLGDRDWAEIRAKFLGVEVDT